MDNHLVSDLVVMKKKYRISQMFHIIGPPVLGFDMYKYGLPYDGAAGIFFAEKEGSIDMMLAAAECHPEIHIVTYLKDRRALNRFESENADTYQIHLGNNDPEIEFTTEWSADDYGDDTESNERLQRLLDRPPSIREIAAINWLLKNG